ncbi:MAG: hypothetical protein VX642_01960 [Bdellovibrionota bacterium]|nr:hypothetical protein [Bdellovibrionota bacterium]
MKMNRLIQFSTSILVKFVVLFPMASTAQTAFFQATIEEQRQIFIFHSVFDPENKQLVDSYTSALRKLKPQKDTFLVLSSAGGSLDFAHRVLRDMQIVCNKRESCLLTTVIDKNTSCDSACLRIFKQGDERLVHTNSTATDHLGYSVESGFEHPASAIADSLLSGMSREDLKKEITENDLYNGGGDRKYTAQEMLQLGIATGIYN